MSVGIENLRRALAEKLREELTSGDPRTRKLLIDLLRQAVGEELLRQAVREELTSGDANTRKLLTDLLLSIVLKDSTGAELSDYVKSLDNLDVLLSSRASESTLSAIKSKMDNLDVGLSTRASESTLSAIKAQTDKLTFDANNRIAVANPPNLDIALTALRDAVLSKIDEVGKLVLLDYTTTALGANASWTSAVDSDPATGRIVGSVYADQAGTLYIEQSPDNVNWDVVDSFSVSAGNGFGFSVEKVCPYARVRYVNGATAQTVFRLYAYKRLRVI
jgi:hypothetical protein